MTPNSRPVHVGKSGQTRAQRRRSVVGWLEGLVLALVLLAASLAGLQAQTVTWGEDWESPAAPDNWYADNGVWEIGQPRSGPGTAHGGMNGAATVLRGNYPDNRKNRLVSPPLIVPDTGQTSRLRLWHCWNFGPYDSGKVQISEDGSHREANFADLRPGECRFQLKAATPYGVWSEAVAEMVFRVRPFFYATRWFYVAGAVVLGALVTAGTRWRVPEPQWVYRLEQLHALGIGADQLGPRAVAAAPRPLGGLLSASGRASTRRRRCGSCPA